MELLLILESSFTGVISTSPLVGGFLFPSSDMVINNQISIWGFGVLGFWGFGGTHIAASFYNSVLLQYVRRQSRLRCGARGAGRDSRRGPAGDMPLLAQYRWRILLLCVIRASAMCVARLVDRSRTGYRGPAGRGGSVRPGPIA